MKSRVLFAEVAQDKKAGPLIDSVDQQFRLRRTVCKGWRNKQWLGRMMAYLELLAGDSAFITLPASPSQVIRVEASPVLFTSPVSTALPDVLQDEDLSTFGNRDLDEGEAAYPVLRGTAMILDEANAYLWTNGFLPRLDTYIGPETPNPLFVSIMRSTGSPPDLKLVLEDIMGLTKINYNACNYSDSLPVTVRFADKVGDVLTMGSAKGVHKQPFKFYI